MKRKAVLGLCTMLSSPAVAQSYLSLQELATVQGAQEQGEAGQIYTQIPLLRLHKLREAAYNVHGEEKELLQEKIEQYEEESNHATTIAELLFLTLRRKVQPGQHWEQVTATVPIQQWKRYYQLQLETLETMSELLETVRQTSYFASLAEPLQQKVFNDLGIENYQRFREKLEITKEKLQREREFILAKYRQ